MPWLAAAEGTDTTVEVEAVFELLFHTTDAITITLCLTYPTSLAARMAAAASTATAQVALSVSR